MMTQKVDWPKGASFLLGEVSKESIYTPEELTDEQKEIGKVVDQFVEKDVTPLIEDIENHQFEHTVKLLKKAGDLGLLAADVPEKYGGMELDKLSSSIITEKIARVGGFGLSHGAHVGIGSLPIVYFGNEEQKHKYLPGLASGEKLAAYALTEPGSGSDALGARTKAVLNDAGTHYVLNGEKQWITNAGFADVFVVYAKIDGEKFTAFIVEREYEGVSVGPEEKKMGIKGSSTRTLILEDALVPVENVLGEIGKGHLIAFNILNIGRYKLGVGCLGGSKRALKLALDYAQERKQFKTAIINFPLIQEKLANMATKIFVTESSCYRTGGLFEQRLSDMEDESGQNAAKAIAEYAVECSIAKIAGSEMLDYVADEAVQIHGGYGFMAEYEVERIYRDSRINRIFEGTNEINRLLIPGTILRKAMKGELPLLEKATELQKELLMLMPKQIGSEPLEREEAIVENSKKLFLMIAGTAAQKYAEKLQDEQEMLANVADIVIEVFQMESAVARTKKEIERVGEEKARKYILMTELYCHEALKKIDNLAKETISNVESGDTLRTMLSIVRKLTKADPINAIQTKREIAKFLIEEGA
ncbi:acyl-CoA dehydrogenase [Alkalihalobacillus alcalophilus ATCC 27647 = CGMCC 1.3604]|uniref:Acyl-CoA dehydrogenase n=2 Tax=Alkalihalobacillus alcalophilus TaxID=1445 RepID=A0A094YSG5_ALKAL|nr:acyl-CoA dehydrogenase [Alkalihalobacillus alcalophilus ATCC 27647 = CGMCC 1.3604]THG89753.1 acyl-CoA dehydrogenase [Alkalihalobacillus alcalophilus ATCC 27647 = CGMCC 1.3604]